ncbi:STAS domain-containing protein [Streptomyces sp. NPDC005955]|uniref:STAS domain-containing protein n=1 Tax=Streptomyces sp. NPDC005955 TaxID=3364738 RepID=UPI0036C4F9F2
MSGSPAFVHRTTFAPRPASDPVWATLRIGGELDVESGPEFDLVVELVLACGPAGIRIDLTDLQLLDCAGLRHLEGAAVTAARRKVAFSLCGSRQPLVDRLLRLTGSPLLPPPPGTRGIDGGPGLTGTLYGYWERVLKRPVLTLAGGTVLGSLLVAALVQAD